MPASKTEIFGSSSPTITAGRGYVTKNFSLWVGDIDKDVSERELYEIFSRVGPVSSVRVCTDAVSRRSLGYAYVNFVDRTVAQKAIETKSFEEVRGRPMRIMWSQRDPGIRRSGIGNVFINNLDKSVDEKSLRDTFSQFGPILSCKLATEIDGRSKGYGFVHFDGVQNAKECIEQVNGREIEGKVVTVKPFLPRAERSPNKSTCFTNLFVKNLPESVDERKLRMVFDPYGTITSAVVMKDPGGSSKCFGFVNFASSSQAHNAVSSMDGQEIDGTTLCVSRAQKKSERIATLARIFEERKCERIAKSVGMNLYVKYLPDDYDDDKLRELFSEFGTITSCKIMKDEKTSRTKGFGFVCFRTVEAAQHALIEMQNKLISGKPLYVSMAQRGEVRRQQLEMQFRMRSFNFQGEVDPSISPTFSSIKLPPNTAMGSPRPMVDLSHGRGRSCYRNGPRHENRRGGRDVGGSSSREMEPILSSSYAHKEDALKPSTTCDLSSVLASLLEEQRKHRIGQEIYPLIHKYQPELAGKITGMFLEMEVGELLGMLENPTQLVENISEAIQVLRDGEAIPEGVNIRHM